VSLRTQLYFRFLEARGSKLPRHYREISQQNLRQDLSGETIGLIGDVLEHCRQWVPYYSKLLGNTPLGRDEEPLERLGTLPLMTKDIIRTRLEELTSRDLQRRRWYYNTSGGSTGEPVKFIQDADYRDRSAAITFLFSSWAGCGPTDPEVRLWGSERDIFAGSAGWRNRVVNRLKRTRMLNAFRMTPTTMREYIDVLNRTRPKLVVAYAQAIYELAQFAARSGLRVQPQQAILTSAGTLHRFMRELIEQTFGCSVFNRYGSREVGDIACECEAHDGLHVAPWGTYVEVVNENGARVRDGEEGEICVTSLTNYAMPLIRYRIGDRGALSTRDCACGRRGQLLERVSGRTVDTFRAADGTLIDGEYFTHLLYFRPWVTRFQVIQREYTRIEFKIIGDEDRCTQAELAEIAAKSRLLLGPECNVDIQFVSDIAPSNSGKYRYTISEIANDILV
jgi:phenylacetate-CoA ligase